MSFLHLSLIAGLAVITVPIMLHMFGQKQPQLVDFPTLRFVSQTRLEQSSSWQLRHFLLLLLRILLLAALVFALARPKVHSALLGSVLGITTIGVFALLASLVAAVAFATRRPASIWLTCVVIAAALWSATALWGIQSLRTGPSVPTSDSSAPIAAVMIVDNGPTMGYRSGNKLRLDAAKEMATWIMEQLPRDSQVAVLAGAPVGTLALDPSSALTQIGIIEPRGARIDLLARVRSALELVIASELERKEVYVITDLMSASWSSTQPDLIDLLKEHRDEVLVQIIDVGGASVFNWRLGDIEADFSTVAAGGDVTFEVPVHRLDTAQASEKKSVNVELWQEDVDPALPVIVDGKLQTAPARPVARAEVDLSSSSSATVQLSATNLAVGANHFAIRLTQPDPLPIDNERVATIVAREQQPTLIVATDPAMGELLRLIVDPSSARGKDGATLVEHVVYAQLPQVEMAQYEVICLFDPSSLDSRVAQSLKEHVLGGGGLLTILGPALEQTSSSGIEELLPGKLAGVAARDKANRSLFMDPVALTHPIFGELAVVSETVPWNLFPVFRSWTFDSLTDGAGVLMNLSDGESPAVLTHRLGRGQIITLTTPIPEVETRGRELWNELWVGGDPWPAYGLLLGIFRSLSGASQTDSNFFADEIVGLDNDAFAWPSRYELFTPDAQSRRVDANAGALNLGQFSRPGTYRLRGQRERPVSRGFSVNVPAADTELLRLEPEQLDDVLGEGNYHLARNKNEVESSVGQARFGRELYPLLMVFVAGLFLAEQAMSNRFYKLKFGRTKGT